MKNIAIIGGGAAGLTAAISAAQEAHCLGNSVQITVFESADRVGKSILATGNGRCNFSNIEILAEKYHNQGFVEESFRALPYGEILEFFHQLGLVWQEESEGRLYPLSNKASTVLDVLRFAAQERGIDVRCEKKVETITPQGIGHVPKHLLISCQDESAEFFDAVIVACGGKIARSMLPPRYTYLNTQPLLAPLATNTDAIKGLNNIRVRCEISGGGVSEYGEILFRDYGISGIAVFNISRSVTSGDIIVIDFLPMLDVVQIEEMLVKRLDYLKRRNGVDFCAGLFLPAVTRAILKMAGIAPDKPLERQEIAALAGAIKAFPLEVKGIEDYRQAQVQRGGFAVDAFDPQTMQSFADSGLFIAGESLDVDGPCGGYNLHWAWTSGILAGRSAVRSVIK